MGMPKISIITVCLNAKATIENTFHSIFSQIYKNYELIVIDGGSTDGTLDIIEHYKARISPERFYHSSGSDNGIFDAMNKGIKVASGDFLFFLNANDVFNNEFVLDQVASILTQNPEAKILFGDIDYISEAGESQIQTFDNIKTDFSLIFNNICHQSMFYNRSLFETFGDYPAEYKIYSDWDFNIKCLVKNKIPALYIPTVISKFKLGGLSTNKCSNGICKIEKKFLLKKYYPKLALLVSVNNLLKKLLPTYYKFFATGFLTKSIKKFYTSKEKYRLNIKVCDSSLKNLFEEVLCDKL